MRKLLLLSIPIFTATVLIRAYHPALVAEPPQAIDILAQGPISAVGHGAMLDRQGQPIKATPQFLAEAQRYYLEALGKQLAGDAQARFATFQKRYASVGKWNATETSELNHAWIVWALNEVKPPQQSELASISQFLRHQLTAQTAAASVKPSPRVLELMPSAIAGAGKAGDKPQLLLSTTNSGAAYLAECASAGVPTPPDWGSPQWVSKGPLTVDFLQSSPDVEVFMFNAPSGVCYALPRSSGNTIGLLGVICLGRTTGNACFWDNQKNDLQVPIPKGAAVPISQFAGGFELEGGEGGTCTRCHAGENPFIIHPGTALSQPNIMPNKWYTPRVAASWPQNPGPTNLLACVSLAAGDASCLGCHSSAAAGGGRFPAVSTDLSGYCGILNKAMTLTMPPGSPNNAAYAKHRNALAAACLLPPSSSPAMADSDLDCVLDSKDNCKTVANSGQEDSDGDGLGNACDNCPTVSNVDQLNTDGDTEGNACDLDDDNDLCPDATDAKPLSDSSVVGFRVAVNCPDNAKDVWGWDGEDSDGDGQRNCTDPDDDNDGVLDGNDRCPIDKPVAGGAPGLECLKGAVSCPVQTPWDACMFGGCNTFLIKILSVINPNPVIIEKFTIVGTSIFLQASEKQSLEQIETAVLTVPQQQQVLNRVVGGRGRGGTAVANTNLVRMEIWSKDAPNKPGRRVAVIAQYDPRNVQLSSAEGQTALQVTAVRGRRTLLVQRTTLQQFVGKARSIAPLPK